MYQTAGQKKTGRTGILKEPQHQQLKIAIQTEIPPFFFQTHKKTHVVGHICPISHVTSHRILYYPLVKVYMTMGNHHVQWGFIHYFDWVIFHSKLLVITRGYIYKPSLTII